jgi:hypothetical protein
MTWSFNANVIDHGGEAYGNHLEKPFLYFSDNDQIHVGAPGELHDELYLRLPPELNEAGARRGLVNPHFGEIEWYGTPPDNYQNVAKRLGEHFNFTPETPTDTWRFGADEHDILDWDEGQEGKGLIDRDGHVYTWDGEEYETHHDFLQEHPAIMPMRYFWIEPDGQCRGAGMGDELDQMDEEVLREADPRLYVKHEDANTWSFAPEPATV